MDRRAFLGALGLLAAPRAAQAQQTAQVPRIGFLGNSNPLHLGASVDAFRQGLRELGWVEGQNVVIEYRWADGDLARHPALVAELLAQRVAVLVVAGTSAVLASRRITSTTPIVAAILTDPVAMGLATTLSRPAGNITGLANQFEDIVAKQLQILTEAVPRATRVIILSHALQTSSFVKTAVAGSRALGLNSRVITVREVRDLDDAFKSASAEPAGAIHVLPSPFFNRHRGRLAELAIKHRLPAMYEVKEYVEAGGLMSYGPSFPDMYRRSASYVDRILKGAKPGDLPIEQPTKFEFVINLKTAKALGLTIPPSLLQRADQVIE